MKLTRRGKIVVTILITLAIILAVTIAMHLLFTITGIYENVMDQPLDHIRCVAGTVLQPDGSCTPQE